MLILTQIYIDMNPSFLEKIIFITHACTKLYENLFLQCYTDFIEIGFPKLKNTPLKRKVLFIIIIIMQFLQVGTGFSDDFIFIFIGMKQFYEKYQNIKIIRIWFQIDSIISKHIFLYYLFHSIFIFHKYIIYLIIRAISFKLKKKMIYMF